MKMNVRFCTGSLLTIFSLFLISCQSNAREPEPKPVADVMRKLSATEIARYHDNLARFFDSLLNTRGFSGGILVAKNGTILYEHYQGDVFGTKSDPINSNTPFHVASTSKTFTSTAILQLEQKGLLHLDDPLVQYWPGFPYTSVTIRHLLNHSSGIPDYAYFLPKYKWDKSLTVTNYDVLEVLNHRKPPLDFTTGSRFKYCNTNFVLLALVVEKVSGLTFPYYVKENIFDKAGMEDSYVATPLTRAEFLPSWNASGRMYNFEYLDGLYGDKNVFTTCRDLMKYDHAIREGLLLDPLMYHKAWEPNFKDARNSDPWEYYGLGWRLKVFDNDLKIPYHNGWWHGNNAVFQRLIADTAVIIVTGNRMNRKIYASAKAANLFRPYFPDSIFNLDDEADMKESDIMSGSPSGGNPPESGTQTVPPATGVASPVRGSTSPPKPPLLR